jgi:hypothetical protein
MVAKRCILFRSDYFVQNFRCRFARISPDAILLLSVALADRCSLVSMMNTGKLAIACHECLTMGKKG